MLNAVLMTDQELDQLRRDKWHLNGHPVRTLEDAPFYARSQLAGRVFGDDVQVMHESLSLDRFQMPIVQAMLPFRMPRW